MGEVDNLLSTLKSVVDLNSGSCHNLVQRDSTEFSLPVINGSSERFGIDKLNGGILAGVLEEV